MAANSRCARPPKRISKCLAGCPSTATSTGDGTIGSPAAGVSQGLGKIGVLGGSYYNRYNTGQRSDEEVGARFLPPTRSTGSTWPPSSPGRSSIRALAEVLATVSSQTEQPKLPRRSCSLTKRSSNAHPAADLAVHRTWVIRGALKTGAPTSSGGPPLGSTSRSKAPRSRPQTTGAGPATCAASCEPTTRARAASWASSDAKHVASSQVDGNPPRLRHPALRETSDRVCRVDARVRAHHPRRPEG